MHLDNGLYDFYINRFSAPTADNVVIVAIDDASLHTYGPWPWPRDLQAQLLQQINQHNPATVVMDIIYSGETAFDQQLLQAGSNTQALALPLMIDTTGFRGMPVEVMPFPSLLAQVDHLGHVQFELDDDAIVRGTYLYQGIGSAHWPHLMHAVAGTAAGGCPQSASQSDTSLALTKCDYVRVPFAGPSSTYPQLSALDILQGGNDVLATALNNKLVLVGLTGLGVGDWVASPNAAQAGPMPGVEFNANLYAALIHDALIRPAPFMVSLLLAFVVAGICTYLLPRLAAKPMLTVTALLALIPVGAGFLSIHLFQHYLSVAAATIGVLVIYPVWSWRRHEIAWAFIQQELTRIDAENTAWQAQSHLGNTEEPQDHSVDTKLQTNVATLLQGTIHTDAEGELALVRERPPTAQERVLLAQLGESLHPADPDQNKIPGERLARQIERLEHRARQVREGRAVSLAGLGRMANGVIIFSALGSVRFSNDAAAALLSLDTLEQGCFDILERITPPLGETWPGIIRQILFQGASFAFEAQVGQKPLYVAAEPLSTNEEEAIAEHWVLTFADLSAIRQAQAQREEALAFLSHDIRSPLTSVLALIRNHGQSDELLEQITQYTQKGLATSDQFLQLSRLQLQHTFETYDVALDQIVANAVEQVFFLAREKAITIKHDDIFEPGLDEEAVWILGNGELLERALVNLLGNAIKYSDDDTCIQVSLKLSVNNAQIVITDQGHGIPEEELGLIFDPYFRSSQQKLAEHRGAGLGLRFVKTVVERHSGEIRVDSVWGEGSTFTIVLPRTVLPSTEPSTEQSGAA